MNIAGYINNGNNNNNAPEYLKRGLKSGRERNR